MAEYIDIYDEKRRKTGKLHMRGTPLEPGEYHLVVEIWTVNSKGELLVTQRHPDKKGGMLWECTGGAVSAGEDSLTGAMRELEEEIGLAVTADELEFLGEIRRGHRFGASYLLKTDVSLVDLKLQEDEVVAVKWVTKEDFIKMMEERKTTETLPLRFSDYADRIFTE